MKFKSGDEVFIKAEITDVSGYECSERPYFVAPDIYSVNWVSEDKIIPMDKTYEMGLTDAWELLKKIYDMNCENVRDIFEKGFWEIIHICTAEEALAKIEVYEKEKEIKVGDEVRNTVTGNTFWIIAKSEEKLIGYTSSPEFHDFPVQKFPKNFDVLKKTGRTTDSIDLLGR